MNSFAHGLLIGGICGLILGAIIGFAVAALIIVGGRK